MATVRTVVTTALRKLRVVYTGRNPQAAEAQDGLESLQSFYDEWLTTYEELEPYIVTAAYTAEENQRLQNASDFTITYPTTVEDDESGEDRPVRDLSIVVDVRSTGPVAKVYSARSGAWQTLTGLTLDSEAPFSERGKDGLACVLALRLADDYGKQPSQATIRSAGLFLSSLSYRPGSERRQAKAVFY